MTPHGPRSQAIAGGYLLVLIVLGGLALATSRVVAAASQHHVQRAPVVYTIAVLREQLARKERAWLGRTLLVRGVVANCGPLNAAPAPCLEEGGAGVVDPLPLVWGEQDLVRAFFRPVPFLSRLITGAQTVRWGETAVYRVQLQVQAGVYCGVPVCYSALLLNADTGAA